LFFANPPDSSPNLTQFVKRINIKFQNVLVIAKILNKLFYKIHDKKYTKNPLYTTLITSNLDVNRIDYLLRDAYCTGVAYGFIDIDRLIHTICVDDENHIAVLDKGRQALFHMKGKLRLDSWCNKRVAIFLQITKEPGARADECSISWIDVDQEVGSLK